MSKVYGPTAAEYIAALLVADAADRFLDAYLWGKLAPRDVRRLVEELYDMRHHMVGCLPFCERADQLAAVGAEDWSAAEREGDRLVATVGDA